MGSALDVAVAELSKLEELKVFNTSFARLDVVQPLERLRKLDVTQTKVTQLSPKIEKGWVENRLAAPTLFTDELEEIFTLVLVASVTPAILLPGTRLMIAGGGFIPSVAGPTSLRLEGSFAGKEVSVVRARRKLRRLPNAGGVVAGERAARAAS